LRQNCTGLIVLDPLYQDLGFEQPEFPPALHVGAALPGPSMGLLTGFRILAIPKRGQGALVGCCR
jgi:hypothetical protein